VTAIWLRQAAHVAVVVCSRVVISPGADNTPDAHQIDGCLHTHYIVLQEVAANSSSNSDGTLLKKQMTRSCSS
jgi:hypothetical protein